MQQKNVNGNKLFNFILKSFPFLYHLRTEISLFLIFQKRESKTNKQTPVLTKGLLV
jgi:hypothetical protein